MDALEQSTSIHALALALAKQLSQEETTRLGLLLVQLGTTLDTIAALKGLGVDQAETTDIMKRDTFI